jgi:hypothetical protein
MLNRRLATLLVLASAISACAHPSRRSTFDPPSGELLAALRVIQNAFSGPARGFFFYLEQTPDSGFLLSVYEYRGGEIVGVVNAGTEETHQLLSKLSGIGFKPFDYDAEIQRAEIAKRNAGDQLDTIVLDGAEWEVTISTDEGRFVVRRWNPSGDFTNYARYSDHIARLMAVIEILSAQYGRSKIGLM